MSRHDSVNMMNRRMFMSRPRYSETKRRERRMSRMGKSVANGGEPAKYTMLFAYDTTVRCVAGQAHKVSRNLWRNGRRRGAVTHLDVVVVAVGVLDQAVIRRHVQPHHVCEIVQVAVGTSAGRVVVRVPNQWVQAVGDPGNEGIVPGTAHHGLGEFGATRARARVCVCVCQHRSPRTP